MLKGRDSNVNSKTASLLPVRDRHVTRSSSWFVGISQDALLLHDGGERALIADLVQQVANSVVSSDEITILCAARSVIAQNIKFLHAHRTVDLLRQDRNSQSDKNRSLEVARLHHRVVPVKS